MAQFGPLVDDALETEASATLVHIIILPVGAGTYISVCIADKFVVVAIFCPFIPYI